MKELYTGAHRDNLDPRDRIYEQRLGGEIKIDWDRGYDVRNVLNDDIQIKNQKSSLSCVGQAVSYYVWVKNVVELMNEHNADLPLLKINMPKQVEEVTAKAIYSQIFLPQGGAYIRDAFKLIVDWGSLTESDVPSNPTETEMRDKSWMNNELTLKAKHLAGSEYNVIFNYKQIDVFAEAIQNNLGVVSGLEGENGRGWGSEERPKPPLNKTGLWGHALYYGAFGKDKYGKYIATPNSWDKMYWNKDYKWKKGDPPGAGWQKIYEDYFAGGFHFNPWTYTDIIASDKLNAPVYSLMKQNGKPAVYIFGYDGLWHGLDDMNILKIVKKEYIKDEVIRVDKLPKNIGKTINFK